jgi:hypothetical protein
LAIPAENRVTSTSASARGIFIFSSSSLFTEILFVESELQCGVSQGRCRSEVLGKT